jgi:predicted RNase H-like HicB family nuclease
MLDLLVGLTRRGKSYILKTRATCRQYENANFSGSGPGEANEKIQVARAIGGAMTKHFPIIIEQDKDGVFIVECPVLRGCRSYGRNVDEALKNIREAIEVCLMDETLEFEKNMTFVGLRDLELAIP